MERLQLASRHVREEKACRCKTAKERQRQQREPIIDARRSPGKRPVGEDQNAETHSEGHDCERKIDRIFFRQLIPPDVKQVSRNERD